MLLGHRDDHTPCPTCPKALEQEKAWAEMLWQRLNEKV